jgi:hypothetical protein
MIDEKKLIEDIRKCDRYVVEFGEEKIPFDMVLLDDVKSIINRQPKTDWIPCEERLPIGEEYRKKFDDEWYYKKVLATTNEGNMYVGFYYPEDECWYDNAGFVFFPIAWQPLPQPYKKEGAENDS